MFSGCTFYLWLRFTQFINNVSLTALKNKFSCNINKKPIKEANSSLKLLQTLNVKEKH